MDLGQPTGKWNFGPWREIIQQARRETWSGSQTTSTFRSTRHGWWADQNARIGDRPTGSVVVAWLTKIAGAGRNPGTHATELIRPPSYAVPSLYAGVYLDLKGAYWSIYRHLTWDVDYCPGGYIALGRQYLGDFPLFENKLARNCVVGMAASGHYVEWTLGQARPKKRKGGLWNPNLTGYIWAVLGAVAWYCYDAGARYWNLDGAIVPWMMAESVIGWAADHGLTMRPKSRVGMAHIKAVGSYSMPGARTRGFERARPHESIKLPPRYVCEHAIKSFRELVDTRVVM